MSETDQEDKTELPTEKRLREAREKGNVPRSRELANVAVLGCAVLALKATAGSIGTLGAGLFRLWAPSLIYTGADTVPGRHL